MKKSLLICLSLVFLALTGCKEEVNTWGMLEEQQVSLKVGEQAQLHFTSNGNPFVQWSSEDPFVAEVDSFGLVTGVHIGQTVIIASNLRCKVMVTDNFTDVAEPLFGAEVTTEAVENYQVRMFGSTAIPEKTIEHVSDTIYGKDAEGNDSIIEVKEYDFTTKIVYDYTGAGHFASKYIYNYDIKSDKRGLYTQFASSEMQVAPDHTSEIATFLGNRYEAVQGQAYQYTTPGCYIFVTGNNVKYSMSKK